MKNFEYRKPRLITAVLAVALGAPTVTACGAHGEQPVPPPRPSTANVGPDTNPNPQPEKTCHIQTIGRVMLSPDALESFLNGTNAQDVLNALTANHTKQPKYLRVGRHDDFNTSDGMPPLDVLGQLGIAVEKDLNKKLTVVGVSDPQIMEGWAELVSGVDGPDCPSQPQSSQPIGSMA